MLLVKLIHLIGYLYRQLLIFIVYFINLGENKEKHKMRKVQFLLHQDDIYLFHHNVVQQVQFSTLQEI